MEYGGDSRNNVPDGSNIDIIGVTSHQMYSIFHIFNLRLFSAIEISLFSNIHEVEHLKK